MSTTQQADFARLQDGTAEDYAIIEEAEEAFNAGLADRIIDAVKTLGTLSNGGYPISRYDHSLQSATRALRDGRDIDYVVAALTHDIGDPLAPYSHGPYSASIIKPFVSEELTWIIEHHPTFQLYYYGHHWGEDRNAREKYRGHKWFDATVEFCEKYDENCFDAAYDNLPIETFEPMVREVFGREPRTD